MPPSTSSLVMARPVMPFRRTATRSAAIRLIPNGRYAFTDYLDDDGQSTDPVPICAAVMVEDDELIVDFAGTAAAVSGNFNAVPAIVESAVASCLPSRGLPLLDAAPPLNRLPKARHAVPAAPTDIPGAEAERPRWGLEEARRRRAEPRAGDGGDRHGRHPLTTRSLPREGNRGVCEGHHGRQTNEQVRLVDVAQRGQRAVQQALDLTARRRAERPLVRQCDDQHSQREQDDEESTMRERAHQEPGHPEG